MGGSRGVSTRRGRFRIANMGATMRIRQHLGLQSSPFQGGTAFPAQPGRGLEKVP